MKKSSINWKTVGIVSLVAGALVYPTVLLVRYVSRKRNNVSKETEDTTDNSDGAEVRSFAPKYRKPKKQRKNAELLDHTSSQGVSFEPSENFNI